MQAANAASRARDEYEKRDVGILGAGLFGIAAFVFPPAAILALGSAGYAAKKDDKGDGERLHSNETSMNRR